MTILATMCMYEAAAEAINRLVGESVLPSIVSGIDRLSLRPPNWAAPAAWAAAGLLLGAVQRSRHHAH